MEEAKTRKMIDPPTLPYTQTQQQPSVEAPALTGQLDAVPQEAREGSSSAVLVSATSSGRERVSVLGEGGSKPSARSFEQLEEEV